MSETDYNARLYEKMKVEQDKYRDWLLHQEPSEILNHTYEYTMWEDIVMCMEELELEPEKVGAELTSNPLKFPEYSAIISAHVRSYTLGKGGYTN